MPSLPGRVFLLFCLPVLSLMSGAVQWLGTTQAMAQQPGGLDPAKLPGVLVDEGAARLTGEWAPSQGVRPFVGERYLYASGQASATFVLSAPATGVYQVLASYTPHANRSPQVLVTVRSASGEKQVIVDQRSAPVGYACFHALGESFLEAGEVVVTIARGENGAGAMVIDAVQLLTPSEFEAIRASNSPLPQLAAAAGDAPPEAPLTALPFVRSPPSRPLSRLTSGRLDRLLTDARAMSGEPSSFAAGEESFATGRETASASDEAFLRRVTLDLIGRQPTPDELAQLASDPLPNKRSAAIDRLLASPACGVNWANYYSDVIAYRTPEPELTFLNFGPLKQWLSSQFNQGKGWDETVYRILTASGKVGENPWATFIGFHQADRSRLTAETTRVFLGVQTQCAECHDHPFQDMPQETFHSLAAFFVRTEAKLPWNDSSGIEVKSKDKGEHQMPGAEDEMRPAAFTHSTVELGADDLVRRAELARWITSPENPWFAKAVVNRVWARLMGRGFTQAVDEIGAEAAVETPQVFDALAEHFIASGYDLHDLLRLIAGAQAYQQQTAVGDSPALAAGPPQGAAGQPREDVAPPRGDVAPLRGDVAPLRGDEVFDSLATAIELANFTPPAIAPTDQIRFPPPPKSTRDLVNEAFGYDPSLPREMLTRSMPQAMFLMNNEQLQRHVSADPASGSLLSKWLAEVSDDRALAIRLYRRVLGRSPTEEETNIALAHVASVGERKAAFEDLLWCLLNSAEFTSRQ